MRYIDITKPGAVTYLQLRETDPPVPQKGEVLIKVAAAGVNRPDIFQRQGVYPPPPGASPILGLEVAGEVVALGDETLRWKQGDLVCALTNGGGYAEYAAVPERQCLPFPKNLNMAEAAALPETCFTVWSNVFERAGLKPHETFLVHGGSGGIGTTAIQMARGLGARVFTTAGNDDKCRACEKLGADIAVNYQTEDFVELIKAATDQQGVKVILDMVGGDYVARNIKLAAIDGRIVSIAFLKGSKVTVNLMPVMLKRLTLTGATLRPQSIEAKASIAVALEKRVWPLIESGHMRPVISKTYPLAEAASAHRFMESGGHFGKIVLIVDH